MTKVFHAVELKSVEVDVVTNFIKDKIENISNAEVYTEIYKVWGQNKNSLNWLFLFYKKTYKILLYKKTLRINSFECENAHSNSLFYKHGKVKLHDKIIIENCLCISKYINFFIFLQFLTIGLPFP